LELVGTKNFCKIVFNTAIEPHMETNGTGQGHSRKELIPTRASLMARLKDLEDQTSWKQFFDTYYRLIYATVAGRGVPAQEAEDVVAEIVEGIARRMPEFVYDPKQCSFKTWLFAVIKRRVANHFRQTNRNLPRSGVGAEDEMQEDVPDPASINPDVKWEQAWQENMVQAAFDRVRQRANPRHLQMYIYVVLEGHSVADTARDLQAPVEAISQAKHRIEKMLRQEGERLLKEERLRDKLLS
jgi:RNA polymerase sigma factor (sigma-70 family)